MRKFAKNFAEKAFHSDNLNMKRKNWKQKHERDSLHQKEH